MEEQISSWNGDFTMKKQSMKKVIVCGLMTVVMLATNLQVVNAAVKFVWPVPSNREVWSGYGNGHEGLDIIGADGAEIIAAAAGKIEMIYTGCKNYDGAEKGVYCNTLGICNPSKSFHKSGFCNSAYGNAVILKHDDGTWTSYAHLESVAAGLKIGDRVSSGQVLGYMGSTGKSYGTHLHFEMRTGSGSGDEFWLANDFDPLTRVQPTDGMAPDTQAPVITDVQVYDITEEGYWVSCYVTDDRGVDRVQFPAWTVANGQDDLVSDWDKNSVVSGDIWGSYVSFYVASTVHRWEGGDYITHIYAFDTAGNKAAAVVPTVTLPWREYIDGIGDVNFDGVVNAVDALLTLKYVVDIEEFDSEQMARGDFDSSGNVDAMDALNMLKVSVKLIELP